MFCQEVTVTTITNHFTVCFWRQFHIPIVAANCVQKYGGFWFDERHANGFMWLGLEEIGCGIAVTGHPT